MAGELKHRVIILLRSGAAKYTTPQAFFDQHIYFFRPVSRPPLDSKIDPLVLALICDHLDAVNLHISQVSTERWTEQVIRDVIEKLCHDFSTSGLAGLSEARGAVNLYLRWATIGGNPGPGIGLTMEILGREVTVQRLEEAVIEHNTLKGQENILDEGTQSSKDHAVE